MFQLRSFDHAHLHHQECLLALFHTLPWLGSIFAGKVSLHAQKGDMYAGLGAVSLFVIRALQSYGEGWGEAS